MNGRSEMGRSWQAAGGLAFALAAGLVWSGLAAADIPRTSARDATRSVATVPELIAGLGHSNWQRREDASQQLIAIGASAYDELETAYRTSSKFEVRRRIKRIVREIHFNTTVGPVLAFLGVSPLPATSQTHACVFPGTTAVQLSQVIAGSSAHRAGLKTDDLIIAVNGTSATAGENVALKFTEWIGSQRPGSRCTLSVLRGCEGQVFSEGSMTGFDPKDFSEIRTRVVTRIENPLIPENAVALRVEELGRVQKLFGLRKGDLIIALDGKALPVEGAADELSAWALRERPPRAPDEDPQPIRQLGRRRGRWPLVREGESSVQVVRSGKVLEVEVVLGERPAYLADGRNGGGRAGQRGVDMRTIEEADASFEHLWTTRFSDAENTSLEEDLIEVP